MYRILKRYLPDTTLVVENLRNSGIVIYTWDEPEKDNRTLVGDAWWQHTIPKFQQVYEKAGVPREIARKASMDMRAEILKIENYRLYEDAFSTLLACQEKGYENYLVSNNYPELEQILKQLGLLPYFKGIVVSAVVGYDKPREEFFKIGLQMAGNPDICYMIGDNPNADVQGGKRMGMKTILVHRAGNGEEDYSFETLSAIPGVLK